MIRRFSGLAIVGLLVGCSLFADNQAPVSGVWGGTQVELTATAASLEINWYCYQVMFPGPVPFIHGDSFAVSGKVTTATWPAMLGQPWKLSGVIVRDTMHLTYSWLQVGSTDKWEGPYYEALPAGHGTFQGLPCQN